MNNVYNRRLFKPRPARAKLNQMGGIMASSVPLMQSVQKFSTGNKVRVGGSNPLVRSPVRTSYVPGQGYTQFSPLTNPAVQAAVARNVQRQQATNVGIPDMPATGLTAGRPQDTRGFFKRLLDETVEAKGPLVTGLQTLLGSDPVARANLVRSGLGLEAVGPKPETEPKIRQGLQTVTEDVSPTFGQRTGAETDDAGFVGTGTELFTLDDSPSANVTLSDLGKDDEDIITGKTPLGYLGRDDGDDDKETSRQIADVTKGTDEEGGEVTTDTSAKTEPKKPENVREQVSPVAAQVDTIQRGTDSNSLKNKKYGSIVSKALKNNDPESAEEVIAEATGIEEVVQNEPISLEDKINTRKELVAKFLGADPDKYKKDASLALSQAFFNFARTGDIGESGVLLTEQLKGIRQAQQNRDDKITSLALSTVLDETEAEKARQAISAEKQLDRKFDLHKYSLQSEDRRKELETRLNFEGYFKELSIEQAYDFNDKQVEMFNAKMLQDINKFNTQISSLEKRAADDREARKELETTRAMLSNLTGVYKLAAIDVYNSKGLSDTKSADLIADKAAEYQNLIKDQDSKDPYGYNSFLLKVIPQILKEDPDRAVGDIMKELNNTPEVQERFGLPPTSTTTGTGTGSTDNQSTPFAALPTSG